MVALIALFVIGDWAALVVLVIGIIYLLRNVIKLLIVIGVGAFGYHLAESFGIDGVWGALAGGIPAATVINKLFGK